MVLVPSATAGGVPLVLARLVEGLSTHQCAGGPWRLEDRRNCSQVSPCAGRLPSGRGPNADRPSMSWATSTARRIAAATWIMSSTTVASRAYAVVPAKRSRWSRGGAYRPRSAPAAGSARHRADAGRRDRAARSPDPQPASCRRSFRRGYPARAAPSTRHHWRPRPDRQPVPGCVGRDVLAGACVPTSGPAGAVPVRVRSRSSAGLRWRRGRLWHPRRQHRPLRTGPGSGDRCEGRRFAPLARRIYVPGILSSEPSQVCPPAHGTVPERRANVQKGARLRGTDRRYSVPFRGSAGRRKDAGTRWLGCCPPEMSTGETHPRAKRPMNRAKTPLRRRAAPLDELTKVSEAEHVDARRGQGWLNIVNAAGLDESKPWFRDQLRKSQGELVCCPGNTHRNTRHLVENRLRGGDPHERRGRGIVAVDERLDLAHQIRDAAERAPLDRPLAEQAEPPLHLVQPGRVGGV